MNSPDNHNALWRLDKTRICENFAHAAATYDSAAVLQREIANRVVERLDIIRHQPACIVDLGAGTGYGTRLLEKRFPKAHVLSLDIAAPMLHIARKHGSWWRRVRGLEHYVCADAEHLPLADASADFVFSNLTLQWCQDLDRTFAECRRVLRPGGLFLFSTLGPDTLKELRASWQAVDAYAHVNLFMDMHDVGDALVRARFADPVMDVEHLTVTYKNALELMRELKRLGAHNAFSMRPQHLMGKQRLQAVVQAYEKFRRDGVLPATHEVVYGHAWRMEDKHPPQKNANGVVHIPLSSLKR
ncbi:MAG: malonyl-ACP O-methyltransferase BioC [Pseudomonadota bacterium]